MRKAVVTVSFRGAIDGEIYPRVINEGDIIYGDLAMSEVANGRARWQDEKKPQQNRVQTPPLTKHGSASQVAQASQKKTLSLRKAKTSLQSTQTTK